MAEPLKNLFNRDLVGELCRAISDAMPAFDTQAFTKAVFDSDWEGKELKDRMYHISRSMHPFLPTDFSEALEIIKRAAAGFNGFQFMFFPDYIERYGMDKYEISIPALETVTRYSSSEFAVRPFIIRYPERMMRQMLEWANSENHHVRRLASEGCRPRLPWAIALPEFKKDPAPILPILEKLKNDPSEYVRRSVANNLNDISKDHPQLVLTIAKRWHGTSKHTDWVVKHGCRTMLKQGLPEVMALFGFHAPSHVEVEAFTVQQDVVMGERMQFDLRLTTSRQQLGKLRLEYAIDFLRKNGSQTRKVFSISESVIEVAEKSVTRSHSFKPITTRTYYPGRHGIAILVNGKAVASTTFQLH